MVSYRATPPPTEYGPRKQDGAHPILNTPTRTRILRRFQIRFDRAPRGIASPRIIRLKIALIALFFKLAGPLVKEVKHVHRCENVR